jgi:hypothetical protein
MATRTMTKSIAVPRLEVSYTHGMLDLGLPTVIVVWSCPIAPAHSAPRIPASRAQPLRRAVCRDLDGMCGPARLRQVRSATKAIDHIAAFIRHVDVRFGAAINTIHEFLLSD